MQVVISRFVQCPIFMAYIYVIQSSFQEHSTPLDPINHLPYVLPSVLTEKLHLLKTPAYSPFSNLRTVIFHGIVSISPAQSHSSLQLKTSETCWNRSELQTLIRSICLGFFRDPGSTFLISSEDINEIAVLAALVPGCTQL